MKTKRLVCVLMACALTLSGIIPPARAVEVPNEPVIWLEDIDRKSTRLNSSH